MHINNNHTTSGRMKNILAIAVACIYIIGTGCKDTSESNMQYIGEMKDSIFKAYPTVASITIEIKDGKMLDVTLGDVQLFKAGDAKRQQTANEMGAMALRIFPNKGNDIDKAEIVVSDDEKNVTIDRSTAKITGVNIDSLRKSMK